MATTSSPLSTRWAVNQEPTKPLAPVTRARTRRTLPGTGSGAPGRRFDPTRRPSVGREVLRGARRPGVTGGDVEAPAATVLDRRAAREDVVQGVGELGHR